MFQKKISIGLLLLILALSAGCSKAAGDLNLTIDGQHIVVTHQTYKDIEAKVNQDEEEDFDLPLDYLFYQNGVPVVDKITIVQGAESSSYDWAEIASHTFWRNTREIEINGVVYLVDNLLVECGGFDEENVHSITEIPLITARVLDIPFMEGAASSLLPLESTEHVVWFFLDGFGYQQFMTASEQGLIPHLFGLGDFNEAYTIYPPKTSTSTAALLSGLDSRQNGIWATGIRNLEVPSILDAANDAGAQVRIIEGSSTPFNYPGAEITLSGDRDGDGSTDDNVFTNAQTAIEEGIPDLLMVHFHGIDDVGHTYGPYSAEWESKVAEIDTMVGQLIDTLPEDTLMIIFPDHGMHAVLDEGDTSLGNHGNLVMDDMAIYIILVRK